MSERDDWELLATYAAERSQEAFARVVAKYADMVFHTALRRTKRHDLAEDVTQAVFIVLARSAGKLKAGGSLSAWLHQTTLHAAANALRGESRRRRYERDAIGAAAVVGDERSVDLTDQVENALHRLPAGEREILAIHYLEGLTMAQTADRLGIAGEAARKRLSRALEKLRSRLKAGDATSVAAISTALGAIASPSPGVAAGEIASTVTAGGEAGTAFRLADQIVRQMRLLLLARAAAVAIILMFTGTVVLGIMQLTSQAPPEVARQTQSPRPATAPASQPQPAAQLPAIIREAITRNALQLDPITIEWTHVGSSRFTVLEFAKAMNLDDKMADYFINSRKKFHVAYLQGKYQTWLESEPRQSIYNPNESSGRGSEFSFDGEFYYGAMNWDGRWGGLIIKQDVAALGSGDGRHLNTGYFDAIGLPLSTRAIDFKQRAPARSGIVNMLNEGATLVDVREMDVDGRKLTRVRLSADDPIRMSALNSDPEAVEKSFAGTPNSKEYIRFIVDAIPRQRLLPEKRLHDFYLDPQMNSALRRYEERYAGEILLRRTECLDFKKLEGRDVWIPMKVVLSEYTGSLIPGTYATEPLVVYTDQVVDLKLDPPGEFIFSFANMIVPGIRLIENVGGTSAQYILEEDGTRRKLR